MSETPILDALQTLAEANPERAQEITANLQAKWETLDETQRDQVRARLAEIQDTVATMSPEEKQAIADQILSIA